MDSTKGDAKSTHGQGLACSSPHEQLLSPPSVWFGKISQLKALYSSTLRTCFPRLSPAQPPSFTSVCFLGHSWRGFYQTLDFLPFNQAMLQTFFPFKTTVKISPFKQDTFPLMRGKGPGLVKKTQIFKDPSSKHKSLGSKFLGKYLKPHRSKQANPGQDMQRTGVQETLTCPGLQPWGAAWTAEDSAAESRTCPLPLRAQGILSLPSIRKKSWLSSAPKWPPFLTESTD